MAEYDEIIQKIKNTDVITIYGAGMMGKALFKCLSEKPYYKKINSFVVKSLVDNPSEIEGVPVVELHNATSLRDNLLLVALHEKYLTDALQDLEKAGFANVIPVSFDSDLWTYIREVWMRNNQLTDGIKLSALESCTKKQLHLYVVHSEVDKQLVENVTDRSYEIPIQVGAALSSDLLYEVKDDAGDNISEKNRQYCELTALYWIWKNDCADYAGLSHYRRRFQLSDADVNKMIEADVDIVVTVPMLNFPTVREQYAKDHDIRDWDIMLEAINVLYPEYSIAADKVQNGNCYYAYNMFIAKKEILNNYCQWLFDILDYCVSRIGNKSDTYQNRYPGFLAERLMTIYFVHNQQYKLVVSRKRFIESV